MQVVRYFHIRNPQFLDRCKGGVTVRVSGDTGAVGRVDVQYAECSNKDNFCKKTGRSLAEVAPIKVVPLRFLSKELERIANHAVKTKRLSASHTGFDFATKYFLPKE